MSRPPGTLLPILHEADWSGRELAFCRPILEGEAAHTPLVAFTYDDARKRYTVTRASLHEDKRMPREVEHEGFANLAERKAEWEVKARREDGWPSALSLVDEYAASFVLDVDTMREAHTRLGAEVLRVAIPTRGLMVAQPDVGDDDERMGGFGAWAADAFRKAFETRVTPATVVVVDGKPADIVQPPAPPESLAEAAPRVVAMGYDEDEARMLFHFMPRDEEAAAAPLRTPELAVPVEIERRGRAAPGQPVDEVWIVFGSEALARRDRALVEDADLVVAVMGEDGPCELE